LNEGAVFSSSATGEHRAHLILWSQAKCGQHWTWVTQKRGAGGVEFYENQGS